jgi:hypothetical protein
MIFFLSLQSHAVAVLLRVTQAMLAIKYPRLRKVGIILFLAAKHVSLGHSLTLQSHAIAVKNQNSLGIHPKKKNKTTLKNHGVVVELSIFPPM